MNSQASRPSRTGRAKQSFFNEVAAWEEDGYGDEDSISDWLVEKSEAESQDKSSWRRRRPWEAFVSLDVQTRCARVRQEQDNARRSLGLAARRAITEFNFSDIHRTTYPEPSSSPGLPSDTPSWTPAPRVEDDISVSSVRDSPLPRSILKRRDQSQRSSSRVQSDAGSKTIEPQLPHLKSTKSAKLSVNDSRALSPAKVSLREMKTARPTTRKSARNLASSPSSSANHDEGESSSGGGGGGRANSRALVPSVYPPIRYVDTSSNPRQRSSVDARWEWLNTPADDLGESPDAPLGRAPPPPFIRHTTHRDIADYRGSKHSRELSRESTSYRSPDRRAVQFSRQSESRVREEDSCNSPTRKDESGAAARDVTNQRRAAAAAAYRSSIASFTTQIASQEAAMQNLHLLQTLERKKRGRHGKTRLLGESFHTSKDFSSFKLPNV